MITIEIAKAIKSALETVVASICDGRVTVYADGVADDIGGAEITGPEADADKIQLPLVAITISECSPMMYRSVLRSYPVAIEVNTWQPHDRAQIDLYTISHAVGQWMCEPTALSLTEAVYDALFFDAPPDRGTESRVQYMRWQGVVHTRKAIS